MFTTRYNILDYKRLSKFIFWEEMFQYQNAHLCQGQTSLEKMCLVLTIHWLYIYSYTLVLLCDSVLFVTAQQFQLGVLCPTTVYIYTDEQLGIVCHGINTPDF